MAQKYRIYINDKVILITETTPKNLDLYQNIDIQNFDLKTFYKEAVKKKKRKYFYIFTEDAKTTMKNIVKSMTLIEAAGGLVQNENGEYLFIYRHEKWDLPKGKLEKDEKVKEAAVREVEEECGIKVSSLGEKICKTYHTYTIKGEVVLKKTHWFMMESKDNSKLKPQREEGITDVKWFKREDVDSVVGNTFPSIIDVLEKMELFTETPALLLE